MGKGFHTASFKEHEKLLEIAKKELPKRVLGNYGFPLLLIVIIEIVLFFTVYRRSLESGTVSASGMLSLQLFFAVGILLIIGFGVYSYFSKIQKMKNFDYECATGNVVEVRGDIE